MNFLMRNSQSSLVDPGAEAEKESKVVADGVNVWQGSMSSLSTVVESYAVVEEPRGAAEFGKTRMRMAIEDHADVPADQGSILIPYRDLPENWDSAPRVAALSFLDRGFVFPGEQLHILVHMSSRDLAVPDIITPFKVAEANRRASQNAENNSDANGQTSDISTGGLAWKFGKAGRDRLSVSSMFKSPGGLLDGKGFRLAPGGGAIAEPTIGSEPVGGEGQTRRSALLLSSFRRSHFFVRILPAEEQPTKGNNLVDQESPESSSQVFGNDENDDRNQSLDTAEALGCSTVAVEAGLFNPVMAGGAARAALSSSSLADGDVAVVIQVTIATDFLRADAVLEVLQYEKHKLSATPTHTGPHGKTATQETDNPLLDPTQGLLQWLLPLDRPASPPPPPPPVPPPPTIPSPPQARMSFSNTPSSALFSFRTSMSVLSPAQAPPISSSPPVVATPSFGPEDWDRSIREKWSSRGHDVGSEGLLSFRGAPLEPQRFSAHCGLQGPHVPGKRWRRKIAVLQPIAVKSYSANCNCQDLICVLVKNVLPADGATSGVVIFVDSLSIICQSTAPGSPPLPVPLACVDVGENHRLPGVALRSGEQHSFILRPATPWKAMVSDGSKNSPSGSSRDLQLRLLSAGKNSYDWDSVDPSSGQYAVIISCHCSHTESRLYYQHPLQWRPRPQRNLLLSVSLDDAPLFPNSNDALSQFTPQVVTVQATNLTSNELDLTLLAPSSLASSPLSVLAFPSSPAQSGLSGKRSSSFGERKGRLPPRDVKREKVDAPAPSAAQLSSLRSMSLPPVRRMESVIGLTPPVLRERFVSAADIMADSNPARTHLWLQSAVPLGRIPAHSTTAVKCELLPLTDGIITLDTLHISTKEEDALYIPENPLQIYATSGIATGVS